MNKLIAALDGLNVSESTVDYSIYLNHEFDMHVVAAFLEEILYHGKAERNTWKQYEENDWAGIDTLTKKEEQLRTESVKKVQKKFDEKGIQYNIHKDESIALQSLIRESHFADMILIDGNESFSNWDKSKPSRFLRNLLADADCPVMVLPKEFKPIEKVVFAYDGSPASTYAIRQFSYLFPSITNQQVEIVTVTHDQHSSHFPEQHLLKELLKRKYSVVRKAVIKSSDAVDGLTEYLQTENSNCMVVLGAYQRSSFSRWLNKSVADSLIAEVDIPIFVAHK